MILSTSISATFDSAGKAVASIGPTRNNQGWNIKRITTVIVNTNNAETLKLYRSSETASNFVDGSKQAWQDVNETDITLMSLESLIFVWGAGTPGKIATATLTGSVIE